ncbi:MAG TPA: aminotransferase class I/II-fold pyridoxal phosphate-dependent enzyme [Acidimicrobiia bacterium]
MSDRPLNAFPLEPDHDEMERLGAAVLRFATEFVEQRSAAPASDADAAWPLAERLATAAPPEVGRPLTELLEIVDTAAARAVDTAGPGYLAYIPGGGVYTAALGDFLACVTNRFVNLAALAPAMTAIEASVIRWLCDLFALPATSQGILTSGGSMANLSALVTARTALLGADFLDGTIYVSGHTHQSVIKAAVLAGFPADAVRTVACDADLALDPGALRDAVRADRAAGRRPFCVVATAGTTNTGAVDPIGAIASLAAEERLWCHVDAAYGGFFQLTERGRARFAGIDRADSITLDPHKGLFLPYGTGCLLVRDGQRLLAAHHVGGEYLQDLRAGTRIPNFADYSPELSRDFRGLRVWLPLHLHGVDAFRAALDEKLDLAGTVDDGLRAVAELEVPWRPPLSIVAFRLAGAGDDANRRLLERINASRRVALSSTTVDGRHTLRVCVLSHRTHRDRIDEAITVIRESARAEFRK